MGIPTLIQDLKVTKQRSSTIFPVKETVRRSMFLSNIDRGLQFSYKTIHFFQANPDFPPETVIQKLETAYKSVLVPYDFMAGRLKMDVTRGRLEIDCNGAGAGFVVAKSELSLEEIGDLVYPNPAFRQLIVSKLDETLQLEDQPLCIIQITSFKCGGFAMGISINHVTLDGISLKLFLQNLASIASDRPLAVTPCNNRQLLAARSPPKVTFSHPELVKLEIPPKASQTATIFEGKQESLECKIFHLSENDISNLKNKAKNITENEEDSPITSFSVVTAHIWRCKALVGNMEENMNEKTSTILFAVDLRPRLSPSFPASYTGNAVLFAYATTTYRNLREGSLSHLVKKVSQGAARMTDEYARSVIDWNEYHEGFPHGDVVVSSWWKLGFAEVEYPWGRPRYSCPPVHQKEDIVLILPDIEGVKGTGVNILVALSSEKMNQFQVLFHKFLA